MPITFDARDHPDRVSGVGMLPLVVSPVINNVRVTKMLIDGGSGLNLISTKLMDKLQISQERLEPTGSFQGVNPGITQPLGKITLPTTFGTKDNYRTQDITFDVVEMTLPYNGIIGRPALARFMAVPHHAYNVLKMPSQWGVLTVKADAKDAVLCVEEIYRSVVAAAADNAGGDESGKPLPAKKVRTRPPAASAGGDQAPKKTVLGGDTTSPVTIGGKLNPK